LEKTGPDFKPLKDVQAIMDILPHRCASLSSLILLSHDANLYFKTMVMMHVAHVSSRFADSHSC